MTLDWKELDAHRGYLIGIGCRKFSMQRCAAEDAASETIIKAYTHADKFDGKNLKGWLLTIHRNYVIAQARRNKVVLIEDLDGVADVAEQGYTMLENIAAPDNPETALILHETFDALDRLPWQMSDAIKRNALGDTPREIADAMGCQWGTIKSRLSRGRAHLRRSQ